MTAITGYLLIGALCMGIAAWLIFLLATRTGQWKDMEDVKYQLFEGEDTEGWEEKA